MGVVIPKAWLDDMARKMGKPVGRVEMRLDSRIVIRALPKDGSLEVLH